MIDYRKFRLSKLNTPEYRHLLMLIFWVVYGIVFLLLERVPGRTYHPVYVPLDDKIPFCEYFLIPYLLWFVLLAGIHIYTLLFDIRLFKKLMWFIIITYSFTTLVYIIYPTMQELRPVSFERDNIFTRFMGWFYNFDTNTNVCPSLHVVGAMAVLFAGWRGEHLKKPVIRALLIVVTLFICLSTVFLKQHSVIDVAAALALCVAAYPIAFKWIKV